MTEICFAQKNNAIYSAFHQAVFNRIIDTIKPLIGQVEGEEIAQEALLKVFLMVQKTDDVGDVQEHLNALKPLVFIIARNMALSRLRHKKVREKFHDKQRFEQTSAAINSIESSLINDYQTQVLLEAVNLLPPICRQVFIHRKLHGKSHVQIAQMLNISVRTVENHLAKGLKLCRQHMIVRYIDRLHLAQKKA